MILDSTSKKIQVVLDGGTTGVQFTAAYADVTTSTFTGISSDGVSNGTTPVDVVGSPAASTQRVVREMTFYNSSGSSRVVTVNYIDGANTRGMIATTVTAGTSLRYSQDTGWQNGLATNPGTVTSVVVTVPSRQTVSGSPITSTGTLAITDNNQNANQVFAGPTSGGAAGPAFRSLVAADIPDVSATYLKLAGGTMSGAIGLANGSAASPELAFNTNYGWFYDTTNVGIGASIAGTQNFSLTASNLATTTVGGGFAWQNNAEGSVSFSNNNYGSVGIAVYAVSKARGTIASPSVPLTNDVLGILRFRGFTTGTSFGVGADIRAVAKAGTWSATNLNSYIAIEACASGSATLTEIGRWDPDTGLNMFGTNVVIDTNRLLNLRVYTVATLPAAGTKGRTAMVSDANATTFNSIVAGGGANNIPVFDDGTNWRIG